MIMCSVIFVKKIVVVFTPILCIFQLNGCNGLKSVRIDVPAVVKSGDTVSLNCFYDLEGVALYSIKWYRNDIEFFRYVPKESPPFRAFLTKDISIDLIRSGSTQVTLVNVKKDLTGDYKCEITSDGPLFHTEIKVAHMEIVAPPVGNVYMSIVPRNLEINETVVAHCHTTKSYPAVNFTWYINGEKVTNKTTGVQVFLPSKTLDENLGLYRTTTKIEIIGAKTHFVRSITSLKCEANIYDVWQKSFTKLIEEILSPAPQEANTPAPRRHSQSNNSRVIKSRQYFELTLFFLLSCIYR